MIGAGTAFRWSALGAVMGVAVVAPIKDGQGLDIPPAVRWPAACRCTARI